MLFLYKSLFPKNFMLDHIMLGSDEGLVYGYVKSHVTISIKRDILVHRNIPA
jgi:hypothetical protein